MTNKVTPKTLAEFVGDCLLEVASKPDSRKSSDEALSQLLIVAFDKKSLSIIIAPEEYSITIYAENLDREKSTFTIKKTGFMTIWTQIFLGAKFNLGELRLHQHGVITVGDHTWSVGTMPTIWGAGFILRPDIVTTPALALSKYAAGIYISLVGNKQAAAGIYDSAVKFPLFVAREHYKYYQPATISMQLAASLGLTAGVAAEFVYKFASAGLVTDMPSNRDEWFSLLNVAAKAAIVIEIRQQNVSSSLTAIEESGLLASELAPYLRGIFSPFNGKMKIMLFDDGNAKLISQATSFAGLSQIMTKLIV